jgi:hypothetical protein
MRQKEIRLFTPWGPRYDLGRNSSISEQDKEMKTLEFLSGILNELKMNMSEKKFEWLFLGADLYGIRINHLSTERVHEYFTFLKLKIEGIIPQAKFRLWSEFDQEAEILRQEVRRDFGKLVGPSLLDRAVKTARAMGKGSDAKEYLAERIAEAMLMEKLYSPIKISCVARHKDAQVDANLPCLYLLPEELLAPWMAR